MDVGDAIATAALRHDVRPAAGTATQFAVMTTTTLIQDAFDGVS